MDNINSRQVWYSLRRTLPPWNFQQMLDELCRLAPRFRIDEVIVKIDTEEFSHGHPTLEWARAYQPKLFLVKNKEITVKISVFVGVFNDIVNSLVANGLKLGQGMTL